MLPLTFAYGASFFGTAVTSSKSLQRCILQWIEISSLSYLTLILLTWITW